MSERGNYTARPLLPPPEQEKFLAAMSFMPPTWWYSHAWDAAALMTFAFEGTDLTAAVLRLFLWCRLHGFPPPEEWLEFKPEGVKSKAAEGRRRIDLKTFRDDTLTQATAGGWTGRSTPFPKSNIKYDGNLWSFVQCRTAALGVRIKALFEDWHDSMPAYAAEMSKSLDAECESFAYLKRRYKPDRWAGLVKVFYDAGVEPNHLLAYCYRMFGALPFPDSVAVALQVHSEAIHRTYTAPRSFEGCGNADNLVKALQAPTTSALDALCAVLSAAGLHVKLLGFVPDGIWDDLAWQVLDSRCRPDYVKTGLQQLLPPADGYEITVPVKAAKEKHTGPYGPHFMPL